MTDNYRARTFALLEKLGLAYVVVDEPPGLSLVKAAGCGSDQSARPRPLSRPPRRELREAEHYHGRALPLPVHGGGTEGLGRGRSAGFAESADRVHVLMNNCYSGDYGVRTARQLAEMLAASREPLRRRPLGYAYLSDCSHSLSFDHLRLVCFPFTAIASAFFWPTMTTSRLPRVTAV